MKDVQVIGERIEFKGETVALLTKRTSVSMMDAFVTELYDKGEPDEDTVEEIKQEERLHQFKRFREHFKGCGSLTEEEIIEALDELIASDD